MIMEHDISKKDVEMVYLSPSRYNNAFEEVLDLRWYNSTISPTAGIVCKEKSSKLFLSNMQKSTLVAKICTWHSHLHGAQIWGACLNNQWADTGSVEIEGCRDAEVYYFNGS